MKRLGLLLALGLLVGCGHGSSFGSAADVAAAIGCTPFVPGPGPGVGSSGFEDGTCTAHHEQIVVFWSSRPDAAYRYAFDLGPPPQRPKTWLHTSVWVVHCRTEATCRQFQREIGGTLG